MCEPHMLTMSEMKAEPSGETYPGVCNPLNFLHPALECQQSESQSPKQCCFLYCDGAIVDDSARGVNRDKR